MNLLPLVAGYRPFLDPIELHGLWWLLLIPLALGVAVVYKAVRLPDDAFESPRPPGTPGYARSVLVMTGQIVLAMVLLALGTFVLVEVYQPWLAR